MTNKELRKGDKVYWYIGAQRCEGRVVEIYERRGSDDVIALRNVKERAILIELENGKKVVKLESAVMLQKQQDFG
jgi:hypothetical protein